VVRPDGGYIVEKVIWAVNCGTPHNPEIIRIQMEGGITFGLSAAIGETVPLDAGLVRQSKFNDYRLLRFHQMPEVEVHIVASQEPPTGVGEPGVPPIALAVANAVFAATGRRFRHLPLLESGK
jgi:isoquinoline 1-oxidoreductase beta subunit